MCKDFQSVCYEAYRMQWMISHGYGLDDYLRALANADDEARAAGDYPEGNAMDILRSLEADFEEVGFDGSLYVCKEEFLQNEFADRGYMELLFSNMLNANEMRSIYNRYMEENVEIRPWYFTFGSSKQFPYKDAYMIVMAASEKEAVRKYREVYPDVTEGTVNCSFWYPEDSFFKEDSVFKGQDPVEILGSGEDNALTWDDIYTLAEGEPCGSTALMRKDNARFEVDEWAERRGLPDPEDAEIPEEVIERYCDDYGLCFSYNGNLRRN